MIDIALEHDAGTGISAAPELLEIWLEAVRPSVIIPNDTIVTMPIEILKYC